VKNECGTEKEGMVLNGMKEPLKKKRDRKIIITWIVNIGDWGSRVDSGNSR
jgi:hypothetical protein